MMVRFWAHCDSSPLSALAFRWVQAIHRVGVAIRVLAIELADFGGPWSSVRPLFHTPITPTGPYINVVCATQLHWGRLWTAGVRNVLITDVASLEAIADPYNALIVRRELVGGIDWSARWRLPKELTPADMRLHCQDPDAATAEDVQRVIVGDRSDEIGPFTVSS